MKKRSILVIILAFAILIFGITAFALTDSKSDDSEKVNTVADQKEPEHQDTVVAPVVAEKTEAERERELEEKRAEELQKDLSRPSQITKYAEDEELTQESIYNRMLNSIDYFDTASIVFQWRSNQEDFIADVTIDTDLRTHKAFQTRTDPIWGDGDRFEDQVSNGSAVYWYNNKEKTYSYLGPPMARSKAEDEDLARRPRHWVGEVEGEYDYGIDHWLHRADLTNAGLSSYCLFPENWAFGYLTDFSCWEITGEIEYLGRKCIEINGTVSGYYANKFNNASFCMYVDEATGILLMLEGYNAEGEVENFVHVSEVAIDQYELTCTRLNEKINSGKYVDYVRND